MPLDPSIILGYKPPQVESPLNALGEALKVRNQQQQGELGALQLQEGQRTAEETRQTAEAYKTALNPDGSINRNNLYTDLAKRGLGGKLPIIQKGFADQDKTKADTEKAQIEAHLKKFEVAGQIMAGVNDQATWEQARQRTAQVFGPEVAAQMPAVYDPALVEQKRQQALTVKEQLEQKWKAMEYTTPNANAVLQATTSTANNTATNATTRRGQDMTERRATAGQAIEAAKVDPFGALGINKNPSPQAQAGAGLSGDEYLATLDPKLAAQVKAIAEGRLQVSPMTMRSPQGAALVQMAMQYEPGTDQTTYQKRQATAKDAASGNLAKSNNALNTVAGHLLDLQNAAEALNNTSVPLYNQAANWMANATGDPRVKAFQLNAQGVASELERAYRGSGGSEKDIQEWRNNLSAANSPQQFAGVLHKAADMLQSKLEANQAQYEQGMSGRAGDYKAITPKAEAAFAKLRGGAAQPAAAAGVPPDIAAILATHGKK